MLKTILYRVAVPLILFALLSACGGGDPGPSPRITSISSSPPVVPAPPPPPQPPPQPPPPPPPPPATSAPPTWKRPFTWIGIAFNGLAAPYQAPGKTLPPDFYSTEMEYAMRNLTLQFEDGSEHTITHADCTGAPNQVTTFRCYIEHPDVPPYWADVLNEENNDRLSIVFIEWA